MKRIILSLLALILVAGINAQSRIIDVNGIYYRLMPDTISGNGDNLMAVVITLGDTDHYKGDISIPSSISYNGNNYDVKAISDMAFKSSKQLTSIFIPASIIKVPAGAFYGCNSLESITVAPDNTVYDSRDNCNAVMESATNTLIAGCKNTVTPITATSIGECAFYGCNGLTSINLPYSITSIGRFAFLDCTGLYSVVIPGSITCIENGTFEGCTALTSAKIPASINIIGECAFYGCPNLKIEIPSGAIEIGENAFYGINTLYWNQNSSPASVLSITQPEAIVFGDNVTSIDYPRAFSNCQRLKSITIPASVTTIHRRAFEGLYDLETINWNANVSLSRIRLIDNSRTTLKNFILGDSVTVFDWFLLKNCKNLETITVAPGNPVYDSRNNCNAIIEYVDGNDWYESDEDQRETDSYYYSNYYQRTNDRLVVGCKNTVIPNTVTSIREGAFTDCTGLTSIYIPASVNKIGLNPFIGCSELGTIIVDPSNTVYDSRGNCNAIIETQTNTLVTGCKNTVIPSDLTGIGSSAFSGCNGLASITIPSSITSIGDGAFWNCSGLTSIEIPSSVTRISYYTFSGCSGLESITIPESITDIAGWSFMDCAALKTIHIPSGITKIDICAFSGCSSLTSIVIPAGVDTIRRGAFNGCSSLTSINIPAGVTLIEDGAFSYCSSLTGLTLPSGIDFIAPRLVEECSSLESINIPSRVDSIGEFAFAGCSSLKSITVPQGVTTIYFSTFYDCKSLSYLSLPSTVNKISRSSDDGYYLWNNKYMDHYYLFDHFEGCDQLMTAGPKGGGYNYEFDWDTIPANAFRGLNNLRSVYIPKTVKAVYECDYPDGKYDYQQGSSYYGENRITSGPNNPCYEVGYISSVFDGCDNLESVAVSFKETKLMQLWRDLDAPEPSRYDTVTYIFKESPMDFNLYKCNNIHSITILDDSINDLKNILMKGIKEVVVSEYVNHIDSGVFSFTPYDKIVERYYFKPNPQNNEIIYSTPRSYAMESQLENITVVNGNTHYSSVGGVLLNKDCTTLITCPSAHKGGYNIPESVTQVADHSFKNCTDLRFIQIPVSVKRVGEGAFENCDSLDWVTIEGSPEIGKNAFSRCNNISSVTAHSAIPGLMDIYDTPQTITADVGEYQLPSNFNVNRIYNSNLKRSVTEISSITGTWSYDFSVKYVPGGKYRAGVGIVPNSDELPNRISFRVIVTNEDGTITNYYDRTGVREKYWETGTTDYDTIFISKVLDIPEFNSISIRIRSSVSNDNYTNKVALDQFYFEPVGDDFPEEAYAGPFTEKVFNNATLYVPDGAVSTYQAAKGWKLFKNIAIDDAVESIRNDIGVGLGNMNIFDIIGRKVNVESIEQLIPGLYIIDGNTYMIK